MGMGMEMGRGEGETSTERQEQSHGLMKHDTLPVMLVNRPNRIDMCGLDATGRNHR
jgi:hypothetical protein